MRNRAGVISSQPCNASHWSALELDDQRQTAQQSRVVRNVIGMALWRIMSNIAYLTDADDHNRLT
jgi:hypothetical protein